MTVSSVGMAGSIMRTVWAVALVMLVQDAAANPGEVREPRIDISWTAPEGCPGRDEFAALLTAAMATQPAEEIRIEARITRAGGEYFIVLRVRMAQAAGERSLRAARCDELARAAALIVALAVEPVADAPAARDDVADRAVVDRRGGRTRHETVDDREIPPHIVLRGMQPLTPEPVPSRPRTSLGLPFEITGRIMLGGDSGLLPELAPGVHAVLAVAPPGWRLEVSGSYVFEQRAAAAGDPETGGEISLGSLGVRGCAELLQGRALAFLCTGGEMGTFRSAGYGNTMSRDGSQLHAAVLGGAAVAIRISEPLYLRVDAHAAVPLVRPRFSICPIGPASDCAVPLEILWQPERVIGRVQAGVEMIFP